MSKFFSLFVIAIILVALHGECVATLLYDNNTGTWSGASAFGYSTMDVLADDFSLDKRGTITGVDVDLWVNGETDPIDSIADWWIFTDAAGDPGYIVSLGSGINLSSYYVGEHIINPTVKFWNLSFELDETVTVNANTSYWLGLYLSIGSWSNSALKGYNNTRSTNGTFDNWVHLSNPMIDHSFKLYGESVPEPATMILFSTGLAALACGARLRKKK